MVSYLVGILLLAYEFAAVAIFLYVNALWEIFLHFLNFQKKYRNNCWSHPLGTTLCVDLGTVLCIAVKVAVFYQQVIKLTQNYDFYDSLC